MARKKARQKKPRNEQPVHEFLGIRVTRYEADISAGISHNVYRPETAFNLDKDDPLYDFNTRLEIHGTGTYPEERQGHRYELTLMGSDAPARGFELKLGDVQQRDECRAPKYRSYRGRQIPVFREVKGMTILSKIRGEDGWSSYIFLPRQTTGDMLALLQSGRDIYVDIHEVKIGLDRWIRRIGLQTTDPAEE